MSLDKWILAYNAISLSVAPHNLIKTNMSTSWIPSATNRNNYASYSNANEESVYTGLINAHRESISVSEVNFVKNIGAKERLVDKKGYELVEAGFTKEIANLIIKKTDYVQLNSLLLAIKPH